VIGQKKNTLNLRVQNCEETVKLLKSKGVDVKAVELYPQGKFSWCRDPDGNHIEIWEDTVGWEDPIAKKLRQQKILEVSSQLTKQVSQQTSNNGGDR